MNCFHDPRGVARASAGRILRIFTHVFLYILLVLCASLLQLSAAFGSPFTDTPETHWASESVRILQEKGIMKGYPDGTYRGEKALSRYEMAHVVATLVSRLEAMRGEVTKEDLEKIRALVNEFREELDAMGVRLKNVEDAISSLDKRLEEVQRVKVKVHIDSLGSSQGVLARGGNFLQAYDFSNGRPIAPATGVASFRGDWFWSTLANFDFVANLADDLEASGLLGAYSFTGNNTVGFTGSYWGVTPPYLNNWWTASPTVATPTTNNVTFERMTLHHLPSDTFLQFGTYTYAFTDPFVVKGEPNPTFYGPDYLPFYGVLLRGPVQYLSLPFVHYEVAVSRVASQAPYATQLISGNISADLEETALSLNWLMTENDHSSFSPLTAVATPFANPFNLTLAPGAPIAAAGNTGVQKLQTIGGKVSHTFPHNIVVSGEYAQSTYNPDTTKALFLNNSQDGALFSVKVEAPVFDGKLSLQYISVDPDYDPFILGYPGNAVIRNWALWNNLPNFYFLHDTSEYPHNRQGVKGRFTYPFKGGGVSVFGQMLEQKVPTASLFTTLPAYVEPVFAPTPNFGFTFPLPFASTRKGETDSAGVSVTYNFTNQLQASFLYALTLLTRGEDPSLANNVNVAGADNWDATSSTASLNLTYAFDKELSLEGLFSHFNFSGTMNGFTGYKIQQGIYGLSVSYNFTPNAAAAIGVRVYGTGENTPIQPSYVFSNQGPLFGDSRARILIGRFTANF